MRKSFKNLPDLQSPAYSRPHSKDSNKSPKSIHEFSSKKNIHSSKLNRQTSRNKNYSRITEGDDYTDARPSQNSPLSRTSLLSNGQIVVKRVNKKPRF